MSGFGGSLRSSSLFVRVSVRRSDFSWRFGSITSLRASKQGQDTDRHEVAWLQPRCCLERSTVNKEGGIRSMRTVHWPEAPHAALTSLGLWPLAVWKRVRQRVKQRDRQGRLHAFEAFECRSCETRKHTCGHDGRLSKGFVSYVCFGRVMLQRTFLCFCVAFSRTRTSKPLMKRYREQKITEKMRWKS